MRSVFPDGGGICTPNSLESGGTRPDNGLGRQVVVVERAEYFGRPNDARIAGSDVFGRNGAAVQWSFSGGSTVGTTELLLLYSPSSQTAVVDVVFYGSNGRTVTKRVSVPPTARYSLNVNQLGPSVAPLHGAVLRSANGVGFVAHAMR